MLVPAQVHVFSQACNPKSQDDSGKELPLIHEWITWEGPAYVVTVCFLHLPISSQLIIWH